MHIEELPDTELVAMPISALCDLDLQCKAELERIGSWRITHLRAVIAMKGQSEGLSASQAVERHVRALNKTEIKGVPASPEVQA